MVDGKKKPTYRLVASTLIEVLVALVIIMLVVAIATTLFIAVSRARPDNRVALERIAHSVAQEAISMRDFQPAQFKLDNGISVIKSASLYNSDTLLLLLEIRAVWESQALEAMYREIIINDTP